MHDFSVIPFQRQLESLNNRWVNGGGKNINEVMGELLVLLIRKERSDTCKPENMNTPEKIQERWRFSDADNEAQVAAISDILFYLMNKEKGDV